MQSDFDVAIVGSGFAGSLLAMVARRIGLSVLLIEKGRHPRFAIGESTSPLMNLLIEELANRYDLPRLLPLATYGEWKKAHPDIVCGLKRGFSYYAHTAGQHFRDDAERQNQLLVAASPNNELADTHWLRSDVDAFLMREAVAQGAEYCDTTEVTGAEPGADGIALTLRTNGNSRTVRAKFVVDAGGSSGAVHQFLPVKAGEFVDGFPGTQSLFNHFTDLRRVENLPDFATNEMPPYPPDDAALHHVFDGGWMWVLRFDNGISSAGFIVSDALASDLNLAEGEAAWERFLARFPSLREQFADAKPLYPYRHIPRVASRRDVVCGDNWALLPSSFAFIDPLFSTGMPLALLGIERLGRILEDVGVGTELAKRLPDYARSTESEVEWTANFVAACHASFSDFRLFSEFSLFYFAAASYSEMARRLEKRHLVRSYLAADRPDFAPAMASIGKMLRNGSVHFDSAYQNAIANAIAPLNIAGLADARKRYWYGVDLEDVIVSAARLEHTPETMRVLLQTASWAGF